MRKFMSLGLLAVMLSATAGQVLAGSALDCEPLKLNKNKSLYGLCVAWHNADEDAKQDIFDRFYNRAGFNVPGSDTFSCACWDTLSYDRVCDIANSPSAISLPSDNAITFFDPVVRRVFQFGVDVDSCALRVTDLDTLQLIEPSLSLTLPTEPGVEGEAIQCLSEVQVIKTFQGADFCN